MWLEKRPAPLINHSPLINPAHIINQGMPFSRFLIYTQVLKIPLRFFSRPVASQGPQKPSPSHLTPVVNFVAGCYCSALHNAPLGALYNWLPLTVRRSARFV